MTKLVTARINPDLDSLASAFAYAEVLRSRGENVVVGFEGKLQLDASYFVNKLSILVPKLPEIFDEIVIVDTGSKGYTPYAVQRAPDLVVEVIDHRILHNIEMDFPAVIHVNVEQVGACSTIITEFVIREDVVLPTDIATLLYGAIHSNTLNLKSFVTTKRDLLAAQWLNETFSIPDSLINEMFVYRTNLSDELIRYTLINDFDPNVETSKGRAGIAQLEALEAKELVEQKLLLIYQTMIELKKSFHLDFIFLNLPSIRDEVSIIYAPDPDSQNFVREFLQPLLREEFQNHDLESIVMTKRLLLRKEIKPLLTRAIY